MLPHPLAFAWLAGATLIAEAAGVTVSDTRLERVSHDARGYAVTGVLVPAPRDTDALVLDARLVAAKGVACAAPADVLFAHGFEN